jgi:hypothetical protein
MITEGRMKKVNILLGLTVAVILLFSSTYVAAGNSKVKICHTPPDNPYDWHTITVSENALPAHLAHGDLAGSCDDNLDILCDDGNPCTIDVDYDNLACLQEKIPVDCDDGNLCTIILRFNTNLLMAGSEMVPLFYSKTQHNCCTYCLGNRFYNVDIQKTTE